MEYHDDSDQDSDLSDTASELAWRAECKRQSEKRAEYYSRGDIVVKVEVLCNPNPCHVEWITAAEDNDYSNVTQDTVVGALGYFIRALIMTSRLLAQDDELPDTREVWKDILDHWLESQGRAMAGLMGRNKHPQIHDALLDPTSPLVARVRKWMNSYEFARNADLRYNPMFEPASGAPPMFAQPSLVQVTDQHLRAVYGVHLLPNPKPAIPSVLPATSRAAIVLSTDIGTTVRTRLHSDATSAGKSSLSDESLRTPAGGGVKVVSLPSTPEDPKEGKEDNTSEKDQAQDGRVQIIRDGDQ